MGRSRAAWPAWSMGALSTGLALVAVVLAGRNGESPAELVFNHHAIGIVTAIGLAVLGALLLGVFSFTQQYALLAVAESLPGVAMASWTNLPGIAITITFVFVLFPDGRLPSPRWRPVGWLMAAATVVPAAGLAARAGPVRGLELAVRSFDHPAVGRRLLDRLPPRPGPVGGRPGRADRGLPPLDRGRTPADQVVRLRGHDRDPLGLLAEVPFWGRSWSWRSRR